MVHMWTHMLGCGTKSGLIALLFLLGPDFFWQSIYSTLVLQKVETTSLSMASHTRVNHRKELSSWTQLSTIIRVLLWKKIHTIRDWTCKLHLYRDSEMQCTNVRFWKMVDTSGNIFDVFKVDTLHRTAELVLGLWHWSHFKFCALYLLTWCGLPVNSSPRTQSSTS